MEIESVFVNAVTTARSLEAQKAHISGTATSRVLVIYVGGTIGMRNSIRGYVPEPNYLESLLLTMPQFHDSKSGLPSLTLPLSVYGKHVNYTIKEYSPLLDSSNMVMSDWATIAKDIEQNYSLYDGFVILHGTDTMAYTCSALSFMLENLGKTIIVTGSQIPISEPRNDAQSNLLDALTIAGHFVIPEVCLYFNHKLLRGNRTVKVDAINFNAFDSPNLTPLVKVGVHIVVDWKEVIRPSEIARFTVHSNMNPNVGALRLFPGITVATVKAILQPPMQGVVLCTYGMGNAPDNRKDLIQAIKETVERGVVVVNCTQCSRGQVSDLYPTGKILLDAGVIPGNDMTVECALTKLSYLLGKGFNVDIVRKLIKCNLRGELSSVTTQSQFSFSDQTFSEAVAKFLKAESRKDYELISRALDPVMLCTACSSGNLVEVKSLVEAGAEVNTPDYDGRSALHVAVAHNQIEIISFLLSNGANVHARDRLGYSPLRYAFIHRHQEAAELLIKTGAFFDMELTELGDVLCRATQRRDIQMLEMLYICQANMNASNFEGRTALHIAKDIKFEKGYNFLMSIPSIRRESLDNGGQRSLDSYP